MKYYVYRIPSFYLYRNGKNLVATHYNCDLGRELKLNEGDIVVSDKEPEWYLCPIAAHEIAELWVMNGDYLCPRLKGLVEKYKLSAHEAGGLESVLQLYLLRQSIEDFYERYKNFDYDKIMGIVKTEGFCIRCPYWYV